jgi:hypothetical protein
VEWAQKALLGAGKIQEQDAQAYALLAMAQHQMKHTDEARAALEKAAGITQTKSQQLESSDFGPSWWDRAVAHILLREAKALIEGERAAIPPPKP